MYSPLQALLLTLESSSPSCKTLDQIFTQAITTGLIRTVLPTFNSLLRAYSQSSKPLKAIRIYNHFLSSNSTYTDHYTYPAVLKACSSLVLRPKGKEIHARVIKIGLDSHLFVQNTLMHFYGSIGQVIDARLVFNLVTRRDTTSCNTMLSAYSNSPGSQIEALVLFRNMLCEGIQADSITLLILLTACPQVKGIDYGRAVHAYIVKVGMSGELKLDNALMGMYAKCGQMNAAMALFSEMVDKRSVVSYTIVISGYVDLGLVDLARGIFDQLCHKHLVLWNSLIRGYVKAKRPEVGLELFRRMEEDGVMPDQTTVVSVLAACASLTDLPYGRLVHRFIFQNNIKQDVFVGTALIDMYSKCGSIQEAIITFLKMGYKDVYTWTTMIDGLANYGMTNEALRLFYEMEKEGTKPNEATFVSVLTACRQAGLVDEGCSLFKRMVEFYRIQPEIEHFGCLLDLLSKAGLLHQAGEFINSVPPEDRVLALKTLLSACMIHSKIELGLRVADQLMKSGSENHAVYVLLSNFYAMAGHWTEVAETRRIMKELDMRKNLGISSIEVRS